MTSNPGPAPLAGNLSSVLSSLGVSPVSTRDELTRLLDAHLAQRGLAARVASLRHGVLTIEATPSVAALLRYDLPGLLAVLEGALPGMVLEARVRTTAP